MRKHPPRKAQAAAVFAVLAATLLVTHCARQDAGAPPTSAAAPLALAVAQSTPVAHEQSFDGVLEAVNQSTVSAQTSGRIVELPVDVDSTVGKGDVIARLKDTEPRARLDAAEAALREAKAHSTQAQAEYERTKAVIDKKLIAGSQMDAAAAARDAAEARLAQAQAGLADAREQQDYALVRAPYAGIVTARQAQLGELAAPGRPLVTMLSLDKLRAVVDVPQQFIGELRASGNARVIFPDGGSADASAIHIFPFADEHTHSFRVRVELADAGSHALYPGELVKVAFAGVSMPVISVPSSAMAWRGEVSGLYVQDEQKRLQFRAVRAGRMLPADRIEILSGLMAGEQVAVDPVAAASILHQQEGGPSCAARRSRPRARNEWAAPANWLLHSSNRESLRCCRSSSCCSASLR